MKTPAGFMSLWKNQDRDQPHLHEQSRLRLLKHNVDGGKSQEPGLLKLQGLVFFLHTIPADPAFLESYQTTAKLGAKNAGGHGFLPHPTLPSSCTLCRYHGLSSP